MRGVIPLESVYGDRLEAIRPSLTGNQCARHEYRENVAPGARNAFERMREAGVKLVLV